MDFRRAGMRVATLAVIAVLSGCATQNTDAVARLTATDAAPSALPSDLIGTWHGWFRPAGIDGGGGNGMTGDMTLEIKEDATYTLISTRRGRGDAAGRVSNDSGVVVANGRGITLKSSSGQWLSLRRQGDALYGVSQHAGSGYIIQMSVEKASGDFASPRP